MEVVILVNSADLIKLDPQKLIGLDSIFRKTRIDTQDKIDECLVNGYQFFCNCTLNNCCNASHSDCILELRDRLRPLYATFIMFFWQHKQTEEYVTDSIIAAYEKFIKQHLLTSARDVQINTDMLEKVKRKAVAITVRNLVEKKVIKKQEYYPIYV